MTRPLHASAEQVDTATTFLAVRFGVAVGDRTWTRCADVDTAFLAGWESRIADGLLRNHGRSHPMTISGFALDWYAGVPGQVGGALFRQVRRVPRLGRAELAFACEPTEHYPHAIALLDERFWCLPDDPDARHPDATVVDDEGALAAVLRAQVRSHADAFLAAYRPSTRLPRRGLLGSFFDGLDTGIWYGGDPLAVQVVLSDAVAALPGDPTTFRDPSSVYRFTDDRGREQLSRRRVGCCYYFKVAEDGLACATCPRVDDTERARRYALID